MGHQRHAVYSLKDPRSWEGLDTQKYSAFKYGCMTSTHYFASLMSSFIANNISFDKQWMITSAACKHVPTASNNLMAIILSHLNQISPTSFSEFTIRRNQVYSSDFASMNHEERFQLIQKVDLQVNDQDIYNKNLIIIDDAYVSGAHERNILRFMKARPNEVCFFYLADLSGLNKLTTEEKLNHAAVSTLNDLLTIIDKGNFLLNARILKFILGYPMPDEYKDFISRLDSGLLQQVYSGAIMDGYDLLPAYTSNFYQLRLRVLTDRNKTLNDSLNLLSNEAI